MMEQQLDLSTKFTKLRQAFNSPNKYVCIACGRRSGKTHEAVDWLIKEGLTGNAHSAQWIDTVNGNLDKYVDRYFMPRLGSISKMCSYDKVRKVLKFPVNYYIDFGSAERADHLEGFQYDRTIINEAGIVMKRNSLWDNTIQPMTKGENNLTRIIGTPKGRNKFWELFNLGLSSDTRWASFKYSAYESPYWNSQELDMIKENVPYNVFQQEYMADFLENNAGVFRNIQACVRNLPMLREGVPGRKYVMGIDLAKHTDFTVITIADTVTNQIVYFDRFNKIDWVYQRKKIVDTWEKFGHCRTLLDSTGVGDPVYDELYRVMGERVEGYKINSATKKDLIEGLALALENTLIYYPNIEELISELDTYEYDISRAGMITYNAPSGLHDDIVISLAMTWQLLKPVRNNFIWIV